MVDAFAAEAERALHARRAQLPLRSLERAGDVGMLGTLPGVLGGALTLVVRWQDSLDVCYNRRERPVIPLQKGSSIVGNCAQF